MQQKRKDLKRCMKRLDALQKELVKHRTCKRLKMCINQLRELQREVERRQPCRTGYPVSESLKLSHPIKLCEYTISFSQLGEQAQPNSSVICGVPEEGSLLQAYFPEEVKRASSHC